jgi:acyl-CoA synthetase (AMP-forming)/AMP-acid ligase II
VATTLRPTFHHPAGARWRRPGGPWDRPSLGDAFASTLRRTTVVADHERLSGDALVAVVDALAAALTDAGVRRRSVVAWQLPNGVAAVALYHACWRIGAVAAPVHHRMGPSEVAAAVDQVEPTVVVADARLPAAEPSLLAGHPLLAVVGHQDRPARTPHGDPCRVDAVIGAVAGRTTRRRTRTGPSAAGRPIDPRRPSGGTSPDGSPTRTAPGGDVAVVLFTSGSTGTPKAVLHGHRTLGYKAALMVGAHGLGPRDAVLMPAPLAHVSGLLNGVLLPAALGVPTVVMASWDPERALRHIAEERVTFMGAPPVFFGQMAESPAFRAEQAASLRLVSTGGASVSPAFVDAIADTFHCRVKRTYGSTEAPTVTTSGPDDPPERARQTDGRPIGLVELRVATPGTTRPLPPGCEGEILLRGPELFLGYADPVTTARVRRRGGWFATGDLGVVDDAGWLSVVGRLSDVIIRAGENISASEVEATLCAHPAVRAAVVVPVPHPVLGEQVAAYVTTRSPFDLAGCRAWFAERGVTRFKTPEHVVVVDEIPTLATGKPDRATVRSWAVRQLAPSSTG